MLLMLKKIKTNKSKVPNISYVTIFGIFSFDDSRLIYVSLIEEDTLFEYDSNMYEEDKYAIVKLNVKL